MPNTRHKRPRTLWTDRIAMERQRARFPGIQLTLRECAALLEFERSMKPFDPDPDDRGPGWRYAVAEMQALIDVYPEEHPRRGFWSFGRRMSLY